MPKPPPPCDFCADPIAPFGFRPRSRRLGPGERPIKTCAAADCQAEARARCAAFEAKQGARPVEPPAPPPPRQGSLL